MILVTLGTQDKPFTRLLKAIDKEIKSGNIKDKVVVQAGNTKYKSKNMEIFDFVNNDELKELISKSDLIITHGGVASILESIQANKKIIAVSRLKKYGEHVNDHQLQIIEAFKNDGYLLELKNMSDLVEVIKKSKTFKQKKYTSNTNNMIELIENYIDSLE